jgi:hypothetical protein
MAQLNSNDDISRKLAKESLARAVNFEVNASLRWNLQKIPSGIGNRLSKPMGAFCAVGP